MATDETPASAPPVPDPTVLTTQQLDKGLASERDYVDGQIAVLRERLTGIDRATQLLALSVDKVPSDVTAAVDSLRAVVEVRFDSIELRFRESDMRSDQAAASGDKALDAALATQKEAAEKQNQANQAATAKSEKTVGDTLVALQELFRTETAAIRLQLDDVKGRVAKVETLKLGGQEATTERRNRDAAIYALVGFLVMLVLAAGPVIALVIGK